MGAWFLPKQIWMSLLVETLLISTTFFLFSEPGFLIKTKGVEVRKVFFVGGVIFLCFTFFWSFILGHLIALFRF